MNLQAVLVANNRVGNDILSQGALEKMAEQVVGLEVTLANMDFGTVTSALVEDSSIHITIEANSDIWEHLKPHYINPTFIVNYKRGSIVEALSLWSISASLYPHSEGIDPIKPL